MEAKHLTCEQRIDENLKDRLAEIKKGQLTGENLLAVTKKEVWTIELSWGGPQDYFEVWVDRMPSGNAPEIESISYHFLDWFDGAVRELEGEDF
jgi:hypothetical protein